MTVADEMYLFETNQVIKYLWMTQTKKNIIRVSDIFEKEKSLEDSIHFSQNFWLYPGACNMGLKRCFGNISIFD